VVVLRKAHPINILHDKRERAYPPQGTVKFPIEKVNLVTLVAATTLAVTLAGIAPGQDVGLWKFLNLPDVARVHDFQTRDAFMELAGRFADVIRPDGCDASVEQSQVTSSATREKRNGTELTGFVAVHVVNYLRSHPMP
jgi:hypothetical protein